MLVALPRPPLSESTPLVVLVTLPAAMPVTLTLKVRLPPGAMVPLDRPMKLRPGHGGDVAAARVARQPVGRGHDEPGRQGVGEIYTGQSRRQVRVVDREVQRRVAVKWD